MIINASRILTMNDKAEVLSPGYIVIEGDSIKEIGEGRIESADALDFGAKLLMPGLVNAHTHTPMILTRGMCEGVSLFTMDGFLNTLRRYESYGDADLSDLTIDASLAEMIRTGTTTFADQYFYADRIFNHTDKAGLRGVIAYGIVELGNDEARKRESAFCEAFLEKCQNHPVIKGWVGPHAFFVDNSLDLIKKEIAMAKKYDTGFHIHFATSNEENDWCREHYNSSAVKMMKELGILEVPILAAHAITVSEDDMEAVKDYPFYPVMCPSSSMRRKHGLTVALGTDNVCSSNSYDLFREMATAGKLIIHREGDVKAITPFEIVKMATRDGAKALGLEDKIGSLEKGKKADIIALDLDDIGWTPFAGQDYYTQLVYSINGHTVSDSMVNGNWLMRDKKLLTVDYHRAVEDNEKAVKELIRRMEKDEK